jgi:putative FmdB family regulatory protein
MPTYAYACKTCGHRFDAVQSFSEPSLTECPECGGPLRKEYGSIGVTFNGSGFYRTDSRSGGKESTGSDSGSGSGEKKASDAGSARSPSGGGGGESSGSSAGSKSEAKASPAPSGT